MRPMAARATLAETSWDSLLDFLDHALTQGFPFLLKLGQILAVAGLVPMQLLDLAFQFLDQLSAAATAGAQSKMKAAADKRFIRSPRHRLRPFRSLSVPRRARGVNSRSRRARAQNIRGCVWIGRSLEPGLGEHEFEHGFAVLVVCRMPAFGPMNHEDVRLELLGDRG